MPFLHIAGAAQREGGTHPSLAHASARVARGQWCCADMSPLVSVGGARQPPFVTKEICAYVENFSATRGRCWFVLRAWPEFMTGTATMSTGHLRHAVLQGGPRVSRRIKRLTIDIPEELHRAIKLKAVADDISMADFVRQLLVEHLAQGETEVR